MPDMNGKWVNPIYSESTDEQCKSTFNDLSRWLGGWQEYNVGSLGAAGQGMLFGPSGSGTKGNALQFGQYRLQGDMVDYVGGFVFGSTTSFPNGSVLGISLPIPMHPMYSNGALTTFPVGNAFAFSSSTGRGALGECYGSGLSTIVNIWSVQGTNVGNSWQTNATASINIPNGAFYAVNDNFRWQLRYRAASFARQ